MDTYIRKQNKREKETKGNTHKRAEYCWGIQTLFMHHTTAATTTCTPFYFPKDGYIYKETK